MPPRLPNVSRLSALYLCIRPVPNISLPLCSRVYASTDQKRKHRDPWALQQAAKKKEANLARRKQLVEERKAALGGPVRGVTTPFLESLDNVDGAAAQVHTASLDPETGEPKVDIPSNAILNHFLTPSEIEKAIEHSKSLTEPYINPIRDTVDPAIEARHQRIHKEGYAKAAAAIPRIVSMANSSQKDKTRANIQRCIETFGRHNTDGVLRPKAPSTQVNPEHALPEKTPRAGPDTGSSEVQIALLTAKIRRLADHLEKKGARSNDKANTRNLRLLVHRRQKLLSYLRRKERGSERWQNVVNTLGLADGTWKGEITL